MANSIPELQLPCKECLSTCLKDESYQVVWCEHTGYAAIYFVDAGTWHVLGPFPDEERMLMAMQLAL